MVYSGELVEYTKMVDLGTLEKGNIPRKDWVYKDAHLRSTDVFNSLHSISYCLFIIYYGLVRIRE